MHVPMTADVKHGHHADVGEPIKCAVVLKPTEAERHNRELVRYFVVVIAILAVLLLIAIAFYYTEGNSVTVKRINSLAAHHPFARLS
jgi:formate hydrogenlyase subunit 3/multisubunit Na+/H+ antiporter MnhD subunit